MLIGNGPSGTGMQETAQITTALKYLPWGKHVALLTDGRFSGFSTGACIGHIGPEALAGRPDRPGARRRRHRDRDRSQHARRDRSNLVGVGRDAARARRDRRATLRERPPHPALAPHATLPDDTRLWAALQRASGGTWAGCVYDVDRIVEALERARRSTAND